MLHMSYEQSKAFESLQYLGAFLFNRKQFNGSHFHILKCNKNLFLKRMITGNEKDCLQCGVKKVLGENKMSHHLIALKACLHLKMFCCASDGIGTAFANAFFKIRPIQISTVPN